ncbi:hypothetical protein MTBGP_05260 [Moorella thermoacetica]|uniref:CRISPR-associated helicase Cas3' n=1 Tax=Neomoorella thermoacetica TaxID=1525 RepID=UPI0030CEC6E1
MSAGSVESHPGKPLENHLLCTLDLVKEIVATFALPLSRADEQAILLHDIGKAHPAFQKRLRTGQGKFGHAEPSAALVLNQARDLLCAEAVRRHHSQLQNVGEFIKFWGEWEYEERGRDVIRKLRWWPGAEKIATVIGASISSWLELFPAEPEWEDILYNCVDNYGIGKDKSLVEDWLRLRILYSILVTADRYEAAVGGKINYQQLSIDEARVENFIAGLPERPLSGWREKVRKQVVSHSRLVLDKPGIYTLTLPTGAGKTITGLQVAMEAARRFNASGIIYVLPFVSLVEQNAGIAAQLFDRVREDHHLAYMHNDGEELSLRERFIEFFRYWQEPVVVTTLAKLWEVLYSPRANDTMSFHRLSRAVVILDEPQAIPANCWEGFGKTLELLSSRLGTTFILMTATQPEIATGTELVPEPVSFPEARHELHWMKGPVTIPDAAGFLESQGVLVKDSLIVLNTRQSALLMWIEMKKRGLKPYFLSRWVTPVDRTRTMEELTVKEKLGEKRCLVATQVIEAGIDLDFDLVFRDLGPMDSIIQVAGRCNRNCRPQKGQVFITELVDDNGRSLATYVYDGVLLNQTRLILEKNHDFDEAACRDIVKEYYQNVQEAISNSDLWTNILEGKWGDYLPLFEESSPDEGLLIVDYNGTVADDLAVLQQPVNEAGDKMEALRQKREVFRKLSLQAVPVPVKFLEEWFQRSGSMIIGAGENIIYSAGAGLWVVQGEGIGRIYRRDVGFVPAAVADLLEDE